MMKLEDFTDTYLQMLGTEEQFGENAHSLSSRDAVLWMAVRHSNPKALQVKYPFSSTWRFRFLNPTFEFFATILRS